MVERQAEHRQGLGGLAEQRPGEEVALAQHSHGRLVRAPDPAVEVSTQDGVCIVAAERLEQPVDLPDATGPEAAMDPAPGGARVEVQIHQLDPPGRSCGRGSGDIGGDRDATLPLERELDAP